jgi:hypothetical protein
MDDAANELKHFQKHQEFLAILHKEGCEYGRMNEKALETLREDYKSDLGSVRSGQKMFVEDIFPKMQEGIREAKAHSQTAMDSIKKAEKAVDRMNKYMVGLFISLFLMVAATVWSGIAKLGQDSKNQIETATYLSELTRTMTALEARLHQIPQGGTR